MISKKRPEIANVIVAESEAFVFIYVYCLISSNSAIGEAVDKAIATATPTAIFDKKTRRSNRAIAMSSFCFCFFLVLQV